MYKKLNLHFVGIGGIGMSGIAEVLINLGYPVSGSDIKKTSVTERLESLGAKIFIGHRAKNVMDADVVVYSSAVSKSNPEMIRAYQEKIPVVRRAEMLAELMRLAKYGVAVAGTHGKTTTTSLLASVLHAGKLDPTVVIGGRLNSLKTNAKLGKGDFLVAEADESDGSFLHLTPTIAIVTNMDPDHMENFGTFDKYREAFLSFCEKIPFYGLAVLCGDHPETRELAKNLDKRKVLYGFSEKMDYSAKDIVSEGVKTSFDLYHFEEFQERLTVNLAGRHNVLNSLAVIAVAREFGVSYAQIKKGLLEFEGVSRRMDILHQGEITVIDDYAHHPVEIKATLKAVRQAFPKKRIVVAFQPHRYTRTKLLYSEFLTCFEEADSVFLTSIYPAGEKAIPKISGKRLAQDLSKTQAEVFYQEDPVEALLKDLLAFAKPDDVVLLMGAGTITNTSKLLAKSLKMSS